MPIIKAAGSRERNRGLMIGSMLCKGRVIWEHEELEAGMIALLDITLCGCDKKRENFLRNYLLSATLPSKFFGALASLALERTPTSRASPLPRSPPSIASDPSSSLLT